MEGVGEEGDRRLNEVDLRTLDLLVEEFEQSGVHLPDKEVRRKGRMRER